MKGFLVFGLMIVISSATITLVENGYAANWTKRLIATKGDVPSLVLDQNGNPHIFYDRMGQNSENDLFHSWFDGRLWHSEKLDSFDTGTYICATADQTGNIHLVYGYNLWTSECEIKYAVFDGDSWRSWTLESGGFNPTITIAPDGFPRIVHFASNGGPLRYLSFDGSSWAGENISLGARGNMGTSVGFLPDGSPVVAWTDDSYPNKIHVARREGNTWTSLAAYEGLAARIAIDDNGVIHLVYNKDSVGQFIYARYDGAQWEEEALTTSTYYFEKDLSPRFEAFPDTLGMPDIVVDAERKPHVILAIRIHTQKTWGTYHLIYGFLDETGWHSDDLARAGGTIPFSYRIVLNPQGIPRVATSRDTGRSLPLEYYQHTGKKLSVSVRGNGTVTSIPEGIACGSDCNEFFFPGNSVTVTAVPSPGMNFLGWSGACQGTNSTCTLIMDKPKRVTAKFGR
jgi:hypothetical protein